MEYICLKYQTHNYHYLLQIWLLQLQFLPVVHSELKVVTSIDKSRRRWKRCNLSTWRTTICINNIYSIYAIDYCKNMIGVKILLKVDALVHSKRRGLTYHAGPSFPSVQRPSPVNVFRNSIAAVTSDVLRDVDRTAERWPGYGNTWSHMTSWSSERDSRECGRLLPHPPDLNSTPLQGSSGPQPLRGRPRRN